MATWTWIAAVLAVSALAFGGVAVAQMAPGISPSGADASGHPTAETNGVPPGPPSFLGDAAPYGPPSWITDGGPPDWLVLPETEA